MPAKEKQLKTSSQRREWTNARERTKDNSHPKKTFTSLRSARVLAQHRHSAGLTSDESIEIVATPSAYFVEKGT
ncbi:MAG: hypothetical protein ACPGL0_15050, partial [Limisphaerales bacterium]